MREACEVHTGDLLDADEARAAVERLHARDPPGGDRRRDRQLPQAAAHAARGEQRALQRGLPRRARRAASSGSCTCRRRWCSSAPTEFPTTEEHLLDCPAPRSAYGFSKLAGEVYCRALHDEHGLPYTICRPFNAYGPGEMPDDEPGIAHMVPDLIRKVLAGHAAAADLRLRRADPHAHARGRHRRRDRDRDGPPRRRERGLQRLGVRGAARSPRSRAIIWEACGEDPADVRARAPAVVRGRRAAPLAVGGEGEAAARLGGADRTCARASPGRSSGCGSASLQPAAGERGAPRAGERPRVRHRRRRLRRAATCSTLLPGARPRRRARSSTCSTPTPCARRCASARPTTVWHLAALASVGRSWEAPAETIAENVAMTAQPARGGAHRGARGRASC